VGYFCFCEYLKEKKQNKFNKQIFLWSVIQPRCSLNLRAKFYSSESDNMGWFYLVQNLYDIFLIYFRPFDTIQFEERNSTILTVGKSNRFASDRTPQGHNPPSFSHIQNSKSYLIKIFAGHYVWLIAFSWTRQEPIKWNKNIITVVAFITIICYYYLFIWYLRD
jgi:hypothetical protein